MNNSILIVEDELLIGHNLARKLKKIGYDIVDVISSGEKAIKVAKDKNPDLILMDIVIKGELDGIETAKVIYKDCDIPIMFLTAYADDDTIERAENTGCYGYLLKPFHERELHANIKMALNKHQQNTTIKKELITAEKKVPVVQNQSYHIKKKYPEELIQKKELLDAIVRNELELYYQPLVSAQNSQIIGAEALVRWNHPNIGIITPNFFIPLAEKTRLIKPIGEWVLKTACAQAKSWQKYLPDFKISVNLSVHQFNQADIIPSIAKILQETSLEPSLLSLELTENLLMNDTDIVIHKIHQLKALGIELAMDDFGTGYSSLGYLQKFPFDVLKIDQCFIRNLNQKPNQVSIIRAIIQMANSLNLKVVVEGIETETERKFICQEKCDILQGFLFSHPIPVDKFDNLLSRVTVTTSTDRKYQHSAVRHQLCI